MDRWYNITSKTDGSKKMDDTLMESVGPHLYIIPLLKSESIRQRTIHEVHSRYHRLRRFQE